MDFEDLQSIVKKPVFKIEPKMGNATFLQVIHLPEFQFELWAFDEKGNLLEGLSSSKLTQPAVTLGNGRLAIYFPGNDLHGDPFSTKYESHIHLIVMDYGDKRISTRDVYNEKHQPQLPDGGKMLEPVTDLDVYRLLKGQTR